MTLNPILLDIPEAFETERLVIRAPRFGDGAELSAAVCESLDSLRPWMAWAQQAPTPDESEEYSRRDRARFLGREELGLRLWLKGAETLVGSSGLHRIDWSVPLFEVGFWCRKRFEGQGYITEAVNGITRFAFETLKAERVEIRCDALNRRSAAVAQRAGYTLEATLRRDSRGVSGDLRDTLLFATIRADYNSGVGSKE